MIARCWSFRPGNSQITDWAFTVRRSSLRLSSVATEPSSLAPRLTIRVCVSFGSSIVAT